MVYLVVNNLTFQCLSHKAEFKGQKAMIMESLSSFYRVRFEGWGALPYLIPKADFDKSTKKIDSPPFEIHGKNKMLAEGIAVPDIKNKVCADISLNGEFATRHWFEEEPTLTQVKKGLKDQDVRFDDTDVIEFIILKNKNEMARPKKVQVEEATTSTALVKTELNPDALVFAETMENHTLPAIPDVLVIGGLEFSEELVKAEVAEIDLMVIENNNDKIGYEKLLEKKKQLIKTRTLPEKFRKDLVKPLADFQTNLKKKTDAIGAIAKAAEDRAAAKLKVYEDYQAELEEAEAKRIKALVEERQALLLGMGGVMNPASLHWTFPFDAKILLENSYLEDATPEEFEVEKGKIIASKENHEKELKEKEEQALALQKEKDAKLSAITKKLVKYRERDLQDAGYNEQNGNWFKNGFQISASKLSDAEIEDEEWEALIESAPDAEPIQQTQTFTAPVTNSFGFKLPTPEPVNTGPELPVFAPPAFQPFVVDSPQAVEVEPVQQFSAPVQQIQQLDILSVLGLLEEAPYVDAPLNKTVLRVYVTELSNIALEISDIENRSQMTGQLGDTGLSFIIYTK